MHNLWRLLSDPEWLFLAVCTVLAALSLVWRIRQMLAARAVLRRRRQIYVSARSGDWNDPNTWERREVPGSGAVVKLANGHRVRGPREGKSVENVVVFGDGGTLE